MNNNELEALTDEIISGRRLGAKDDLSFFIDCDLEALGRSADRLRKHFSRDRVDLCTIINGKSGSCSEDCRFCAQSAHHHTSCEAYPLLDPDRIITAAKGNEAEGVSRFAIVTSGRCPSDEDFEKIISIYTRMRRELKFGLCASLGFLTDEQFRRLYAAGVHNYHNNIETSRRFFPSICTTHTFDEKLANIQRARNAGFTVCSGGIIGMGETWEDRIDMAVTLSTLGISSIPINALMPIPGTPFESNRKLTEAEILRTVAIFRFINPSADIRMAAGRALLSENGKKAFLSGASATITGNMLTTTGSTIGSDKEMLLGLGRTI